MPDARGITYLLGRQSHARGSEGDDEEIARLAGRQHGIVARRQLLDLRVSERAIHHRLRAGRLRRLHPGVYAVGHEAIEFRGTAAAAALAVAPGVAVSHWSAAALHGFGRQVGEIVHVTATQPRAPRVRVVVHRAALPDAEVEIVRGIPATTVARTLLDLSGIFGEQALRRLVKRAEFEGLTDLAALAAILERHPRRRGRRRLARIVEAPAVRAGLTNSGLEDRFLDFCVKRGLPLPETNAPLHVRGRHFEVDCIWRDERLIGELDSRAAHAGGLAFEDDRERDRILVASGYAVMRVTRSHLRDRPSQLEDEIRAALAARTADARGIAYTGGM